MAKKNKNFTATIREISRAHIQRRAKPALERITFLMKEMGIHGSARVYVSKNVPIIEITADIGSEEARMILPPKIGGFRIIVIKNLGDLPAQRWNSVDASADYEDSSSQNQWCGTNGCGG